MKLHLKKMSLMKFAAHQKKVFEVDSEKAF